ncbi:MAG: hypothetical protein HC906_16120, partial [Bacteroidales bacterium]|nr:hypothetical protein [Bacteroidales bacterium]
MLFFSCFEEEKPYPPFEGEIITIDKNIGYYQSYFNLKTKEVVASNSIEEWDMGFASNEDGWAISINSAKNLFVWNSREKDLNAPIDFPQKLEWEYNNPAGYADSTAFGVWCDTS